MEKRSVDIIIPCYNMSRYLPQAIESALAQSYRPLRVLVVDDGSTEDIRTLVQSYGERVQYLRQENQGQAAARNTGISHTRGDYLCFLDADDILLPTKTASQVDYLDRHPEVDLVYGRSLFFDGDDWRFPYAEWRPYAAWDDHLDPLSVICPFSIHSGLLRRSMIARFGNFNADLRGSCEDWAFWADAAIGGARFVYSGALTSLYRRHSASSSAGLRQLARNESIWMQVLVEKLQRAGALTGQRRQLVSCGLRFTALRFQLLGDERECARLTKLSGELLASEPGAARGAATACGIRPVSIGYLLLAQDFCALGFSQLALFVLLHGGDFRLIRHDADKLGLGGAFAQVIARLRALADETAGEALQSLCAGTTPDKGVADGEKDFFEQLEFEAPGQASSLSYLLHQLGRLDLENGETEAALSKFRRAIDLNPYFWDFYQDMIQALRAANRSAEAAQVARHLLEIDPESTLGHYLAAGTLFRVFRLVSAARHLNRAFKTAPAALLRHAAGDIDRLVLQYFGWGAWSLRKRATGLVMSCTWLRTLLAGRD
jgi:GT2 family glycosyltransferase